MCLPKPPSPPNPAAQPSVAPSLPTADSPILGDPTLGSRGASLLGRLALRLGSGITPNSTPSAAQGGNPGTSTPGTGRAPSGSPGAFAGGALGSSLLRLGSRGLQV